MYMWLANGIKIKSMPTQHPGLYHEPRMRSFTCCASRSCSTSVSATTARLRSDLFSASSSDSRCESISSVADILIDLIGDVDPVGDKGDELAVPPVDLIIRKYVRESLAVAVMYLL